MTTWEVEQECLTIGCTPVHPIFCYSLDAWHHKSSELRSNFHFLSVGIESVESVDETFKMTRIGHVSIDTEIVSVSISKETLMCVEHNLGNKYEVNRINRKKVVLCHQAIKNEDKFAPDN